MDLRTGAKLLWSSTIHIMDYGSEYLSPSWKKKCSFSLFTLKECWIFNPNPTIEVNGILIGSRTLHAYWYFLSQRASREFPKYLSKAYQYFLFHYLQLANPYAFINDRISFQKNMQKAKSNVCCFVSFFRLVHRTFHVNCREILYVLNILISKASKVDKRWKLN
jgi:hypothetical protein